MLAKRRALPPLAEPPYDMMQMQKAQKNIAEGSVLVKPDRDQWMACMGELVQLCNEAVCRPHPKRPNVGGAAPATPRAERRQGASRSPGGVAGDTSSQQEQQQQQRSVIEAKPLSMEYIADRMDVDGVSPAGIPVA